MGLELESLVKLVGHTQLSKTGIAMKFVVVQSLIHVQLFATLFIMRNARLEEAQAGIKIASNLRYAHDTALMAESEELKSCLVKMKEVSE